MHSYARPVVESGRLVYFVIHSQPNQPVHVILRYPSGLNDRQIRND